MFVKTSSLICLCSVWFWMENPSFACPLASSTFHGDFPAISSHLLWVDLRDQSIAVCLLYSVASRPTKKQAERRRMDRLWKINHHISIIFHNIVDVLWIFTMDVYHEYPSYMTANAHVFSMDITPRQRWPMMASGGESAGSSEVCS